MRTKKQRFISILLTLAMVIGLMSGLTVTAYAADTFTVHPWRVNSSNDYGALTTDAALPYNTTTSALMKKVGFSQSLDQDSGFSIASVAITSGSNVALGTPTGTAGQKGYDVPVTINGEGEFVLKIQRTNGYYDVEIRVVVSKNENTPVNEWSENKSITADTTIDGGVLVTADVKVTIAEGKTLTVNGGINATDHTLTVKGPGTLIVNGTNGDVGEEGGTAFTGNLVVDDGAVTMTGGKGGNFSMLNAPGVGGHGVNGNVTVNGGSIKVFGGNGNY
ncbi:MAG: hypothetical protein IKX96_04305, partial [Firmicutes bacterium]|nr:hypothetical protein [Bacillota bacterium]